MKKVLNIKIIVFLFVALMTLSLFAACEQPPEESPQVTLPDFSFTLSGINGDFTVTDDTLKDLTLYECSFTKNEVTTYYKGFKVSDVLSAAEGFNETAPDGLKMSASDGYYQNLPSANYATAYLCIMTSSSEDGEYTALDSENGPVRLIDMTNEGAVKAVKMFSTAQVLTKTQLISSITLTDGETNLTIDNLTGVLYKFSTTKNDVTTYYKGYKVTDILAELDIEEEGIVSITFTAQDDYFQSLAEANTPNGYLAVLTSTTENGTYSALDVQDDGEVKAIDTSSENAMKNVKKVAEITIIRTM